MTIIIDMAKLAVSPKQAARKVVDLFSWAGLTVVDVSSDGKLRREAGISFRELALNFTDGQKLALRVKSTGDVYQVRLNDKVIPVAAQDDASKAVAELVKRLDVSRGAFQKRMAAIAMKPPESIKTAAPKLEESLKSQIAQVDAEIQTAREELAALQAA